VTDVPFETSVYDAADAVRIETFYGNNADVCCPLKCNKVIPKSFAVEER